MSFLSLLPSGSMLVAYPVSRILPNKLLPQSVRSTSCLHSMVGGFVIAFVMWGRMASALRHQSDGHRPSLRSTIHSMFQDDEMQTPASNAEMDHGYPGIMSPHLWIHIEMARAMSHVEY